jgi:hypothetical protein
MQQRKHQINIPTSLKASLKLLGGCNDQFKEIKSQKILPPIFVGPHLKLVINIY